MSPKKLFKNYEYDNDDDDTDDNNINKIEKTTMTLCWLLKAQEIKDTCCSERTCRNAKL